MGLFGSKVLNVYDCLLNDSNQFSVKLWKKAAKCCSAPEAIQLLEHLFAAGTKDDREWAGDYLMNILAPDWVSCPGKAWRDTVKHPEQYYDHNRCLEYLEKLAHDTELNKQYYLEKAYHIFREGQHENQEKAKYYLGEICDYRWGRKYITTLYEYVKDAPIDSEEARRRYPRFYDLIDYFPEDEQNDIIAHMRIYLNRQDEMVLDYMIKRGVRLKNDRQRRYELKCKAEAIKSMAAKFRDEWDANNRHVRRTQSAYQSQSRYIRSQMDDYRKKLDARERAVNSLVSRQFKTNAEMNLTGNMSNSDYSGWDFLRWELETKKSEELQSSYREMTKQEENPFSDLAGEDNGPSAIDIYEMGIDLDNAKKEADALEMYELAASMGHVEAMFSAGYDYYFGCGTEKDAKKALKYFYMGAQENCDKAQMYIGVLYADGKVVERDYQIGRKYTLMAALNGNCRAMYNVGLLLEHGKGFEKNAEKALYWYRKAKEEGEPLAEKAIARLTGAANANES